VRTAWAVALCAWLFGAQPYAPKAHLPRFEDLRVEPRFEGVPAKPRFTAPAALAENHQPSKDDLLPDADERYRESVTFYARQGPNFAGHYTIAQWSCGTGCSSSVMVDAQTGQLYRKMPYGTLDTSGTKYTGLSFRVDSSLLIVEGCIDNDQREQPDCSRSYYRWSAPRFVLLRKVPLLIPQWLKR
jgi:hypothetical protein